MSIMDWINERVNIRGVSEFAFKKKVPVFYGTIWYYLGGVSLFLFAIQLVTGILYCSIINPVLQQPLRGVKLSAVKLPFGC